jgi:hypothetical protein
MLKDAALAIQFKKHMRATQRGLSKQFQNTRTCQAFYAGDMMDYRDQVQFVSQTGQKKRAMVQFNKVKPYVNAVKGFMAQNRRKPRYEAMIRGQTIQELYSKYANCLSDFCRDKMHADQVETQQDGDMLIAGYGAVETALTYGQGHSTTDPNGEIVMGRLDPLAVGWDPFAKQTNMLDARWVYYERDYALHDALELFSDSEEQDFDDAVDLDHDDDGGYSWYARGGRYNKIKEGNVDWSDERANMVKVYFYQWVEYETYYRAENPVKGLKNPVAQQWAQMQLDALAQEFNEGEDDDQFTFNPRDEILSFDDKMKKRLEEHFGEFVQCYPFKRKVFYTSVLSKNHIFTKYRSICQSGFSVKFKTGDYDSKNKIWTGMVNGMKEPTLYYNKALTELMFTIGTNTKGGWFVEKDAVEDISDFEQKVAKTDSVVVVETGALSGAAGPKIKAKREGYAPTGYENILTLTDKSIVDANGIDKAFLGSSENKQETGILLKRRIKQVVSALACYFDSITLYQIEEARLLLDFLRVYAENNAGGLFHIIGPDGRRQFLQISADKLAPDYDVTPGEAPESQEEKYEHAELITGVADKILQTNPRGAMMLYSIAIKYMPLDSGDLQQILKVLVPQGPNVDPAYVQKLEQQVQQLTSQATQAQMQKLLADIAMTHAKAVDIGAQTEMRGAQQTKVEQEALRTALENSMLRSEPPDTNPQVRVTI